MDRNILLFSVLIPIITIIIVILIDITDNEDEGDLTKYIRFFVINVIITFFGIFMLTSFLTSTGLKDMNVEVGLPN